MYVHNFMLLHTVYEYMTSWIRMYNFFEVNCTGNLLPNKLL